MKYTGHKIGIAIIILILGYIFWQGSPEENKIEAIIAFSCIVLFLFSGFYRFKAVYKLKKLKNQTDEWDFIKYFNNLTMEQLIFHVVTPFPIFKRMSATEERALKTRVNIFTVVLWVSFGGMIIFI